MKVWFRSKTMQPRILPVSLVLLTMFYGFVQQAHSQQAYKIKKVVIDAGHGGKDPGCHGHHSKEKEIALSVALSLGKKISNAFPDVKVIYTRETDVFIPLNERAAIANRNQADLFISIHCNYIGIRNRATGSETYVLGLHRAEDNLDVAKRENASILLEEDYEKTYNGFDPYSPEGHIILTMFQNAHLEQSIVFATHVQNSIKKHSILASRGVKQAGFLVLRETTMPSVLIETGFLSTDVDENYLMKKENQEQMADCIYKAFVQYKKEMDEADAEIATAQEKKDTIRTTVQHTTSTTTTKTTTTTTTNTKEVLVDIIYRIQIAASAKPSVDSRYQALEDLEIIKEDELYKYLVGRFISQEAARKRLSALKTNGFEGAFIVAYKEGRRVRA